MWIRPKISQASIIKSGHCRKGNVIFAAELARRYGDQGIVSTSLNPGTQVALSCYPALSKARVNAGNIRTELHRYAHPFLRFIFVSFIPRIDAWLGLCNTLQQDVFLYHPSYGAITQLYAGTSPEGKDLNGKVNDSSFLIFYVLLIHRL